MGNGILIILLVVLLVIVFGIIVVILISSNGSDKGGLNTQQMAVSASLRNLVAAQRAKNSELTENKLKDKDAQNLAILAASEGGINKKHSSGSRMTLEKKLYYAKLPITPIQFRLIQVVVTIIVFIPAYRYLEVYLQVLAIVLVPQLLTGFVDMVINKRFSKFDEDYPVLLMSYVSLLKTGMNAIGGLGSAAEGLDEGSLVKSEVELMIERMRLGLTEEQAIGAFGEDIAHPELELFVQGLILSRRVGGQLSTTLERLAKQVRKRQQFRKQALAAVGLEKSSIYVIAVIMSLLMIYLWVTAPELVAGAFSHPTGKSIFQAGIAIIIFGFWWSNKVTKIKI